MKRALLWWLLNGIAAGMLYLGYFQDIEGAQNVFLFLVWFNFVLALCVVPYEKSQESIRKKGRCVPVWVSVSYDVAMVCVMVWIGLWFSAIAFTLSAFIHNGIHMKDDESKVAA